MTMTLEEMIAGAVGQARATLQPDREIFPMAALQSDEGVTLVGLSGLDGAGQARALRAACAKEQATMVVHLIEAWGADFDKSQVDDPDLIRLLAKEIQVRDLPPEKRYDIVVIYAEEIGKPPVYRMYRINAERTDMVLEPTPEPPGTTESRFWPLLKGNVGRTDLAGGTHEAG